MQVDNRIQLTIEVDVDAEPVAGHVRSGAGCGRAFTGWLELAAALEDVLRAGGRPRRAGTDPREINPGGGV